MKYIVLLFVILFICSGNVPAKLLVTAPGGSGGSHGGGGGGHSGGGHAGGGGFRISRGGGGGFRAGRARGGGGFSRTGNRAFRASSRGYRRLHLNLNINFQGDCEKKHDRCVKRHKKDPSKCKDCRYL